ncbi:GHKL domain-containing protein, partial [bacterium]|nr:GHKL domain-containing protein [bacterium]
EKIMSQLFHGLAHEIKNPLSGIKGAAQLISQIKSSDKEISDCCAIIEKEASRLSSLVDTFRLLQPSDETNYEIVDINEIITSTISICLRGSGKKDIRVSFDSISDTSKVYGFKELLNIVFMNIIKNAFEAIDVKGSVKINIKHLKDYKINNKNFIVTEISDNGSGIQKESINNLFKPFFSTKKKGQGIGLFLSQKIVNKIGGFIEAESSNNQTSFKIFLPDASQ